MPTTKITAAAIGAALSLIIVWVVSMFGVDVPPEIASAFTTLLSIGFGYIVPEKNV